MYFQLRVESTRLILRRDFRGNILTKKSKTENIWASAGFESNEERVTLSDSARRLLDLIKKLVI